jgi:hypothetical protein
MRSQSLGNGAEALAGSRVAVIGIQLSQRDGDVGMDQELRVRDGHPGFL